MKRILKIILIGLLLFNCTQKNSDIRIVEFEKELGKKNTKALNLLVTDFEKNLNKIYPDLSTSDAYKQYLLDIISDKTTNWEKFDFQSNETNSEFHTSGLWNEIYEYHYLTNDTTKTLSLNNTGKYMRAMYSVKESDSLIKEYWKKREAAGIIQNEIFVSGILSLNPEFDNYFHKRIVVVEFSF